MIRDLLPSLIALSLFSYASASPGNETAKGNVTGNVRDAHSKQAIEFATVSLYKLPDTTLAGGAISDADGTFGISGITEGNYFLRVGYIGYETQQLAPFSIASGSWQHVVPDLYLQTASTALAEVEVTAERSLVENRIDKKVFNAEKSMASQSGTGLDLMKEVPSVDVDAEDNISLRGDGNVRILVDGRPLTIPASQYLKQLPASAIERVEVVTNPSAKYDPEGMSGILNIILKKQSNAGFNGNANIGYGYGVKSKTNTGVNINLRKNKWNVTANYNMGFGQGWYGGDLHRSYVLNDTLHIQQSSDDGSMKYINHWAQGGVDYFANDFNTLYFSASRQFGPRSGMRNFTNGFYDGTGMLTWASERVSESDVQGSNTRLNGGWQKKFKKEGQTFDSDIDYSMGANPNHEQNREYFMPADPSDVRENFQQSTRNDQNTTTLTSRNDLVIPLTDSIKWESGVHYNGTRIDQEFYSETFQSLSGKFEPDTLLNNRFEYLQQVFAVYTIFGFQEKKWGYQAGLRAEQTLIDATLINSGETLNTTYLSLFPSAHVTRKLGEMNEISFSYSRRINRPGIHELNPFPSSSDPYTIMTGNPFLKPEFIHVGEIGYLWFRDKFNVNATIYYRYINDMKRRFLDLSDEGVSVVSFDNLATGRLSGGEIIFTYTPVSWIRNTLTMNAWQNRVNDPSLADGLSMTNHGWSSQLSSQITLPKSIMAQINGNYRSKMVVVQGILVPRYTIDFSIRKSFMKKQATVSLRVSDIFNTGGFRFESRNLEQYTFVVDRRWESRQVWLTLNYAFGKMQKGPGRRKGNAKDASDNFSMPDMR